PVPAGLACACPCRPQGVPRVPREGRSPDRGRTRREGPDHRRRVGVRDGQVRRPGIPDRLTGEPTTGTPRPTPGRSQPVAATRWSRALTPTQEEGIMPDVDNARSWDDATVFVAFKGGNGQFPSLPATITDPMPAGWD